MAKRESYVPGSMNIKNMATKVKRDVGPTLDLEIDNAASGQSPEQLADAQMAVETWAPKFQQRVAAAATDEEAAAITEEEKRLITERAEIGKRGLSTGERIAMAILSAAPLVASAATAGSDFNAAAAGSNQIAKGFMDANRAQNELEMGQKDLELGQLDKRRQEYGRKKERDQEYSWKDANREDSQKHDMALENMRQSGAEGKENAKLAGKVSALQSRMRKEIVSNKLAQDAAKAVKTYAGFYDVIDDPSGFNDFMASYAAGKIGDPSTGIRDAERTDLMKAGGFMEQLKNSPQKFMNGTQFTPEAREKFKTAMDQAIKVHHRYLNQGLKQQADAMIAGEDPEVASKLNSKLLIEGAGYGLDSIVTPKAAARLKSAEIEEKQRRLMELRAKAGK